MTTYKDAGVDIDAGNKLVDNLKQFTPNIGGFGAAFELPSGYKNPVLISCTDGVGTKLRLAMQHNRHDTVGIDLVAMCVNDLITCGADPLFFLDYYATGKLDVDIATKVIKGITLGCELASCKLIGGETAEMPGMYHDNDYDIAGFAVGIVEKDKMITCDRVQEGDVLVAVESSGPHSNGFSLIRKVLEDNEPPKEFIDRVLAPTTIYVDAIRLLRSHIDIHGIAHITGGGLPENVPRIMPKHLKADINYQSWFPPSIYDWIQDKGRVPMSDMFRTFNMGVGMVVVVPPEQGQATIDLLHKTNNKGWIVGRVTKS